MTSSAQRFSMLSHRVCGIMLLAAASAALAARAAGAHTAADALAAAGLDAARWECVLAWEERAPAGAWVAGFRLLGPGGAAEEVYLDAAGARVTPAALGMPPKDWSGAIIEQPAEWLPAFAKSAPLRPVPRAAAPPVLQTPVPELPAPDGGEAKGAQRIGVRAPVGASAAVRGGLASAGAWETLDGGAQVWSLLLDAPGARGLRLRIEALGLPAGAALAVFGADAAVDAHRVTQPGWTPTCWGESVRLECVLEAGADRAALDFEVAELVYVYAEPGADAKTAGLCNLDASCYAAWGAQAIGVGGIGAVDAAGALYCTGSLVADGDPDTQVPYFLTADHCIAGQSAADTVEVYWLYQNAGCASPPGVPRLVSVPRTAGGAALLSRSSVNTGSDHCLLRLRGAPPAGLVYLGFSSRAPALGGAVVCIHHPRGDWKRISFGHTTDDGSPTNAGRPLQALARFHEVLWDDGTTEGGSSGSPLFDASNGLLLGQLWGGRASCTRPLEPDYYGRYDVTLPLVERWLGPPAPPPFDLDESGAFDSADVQLVINAALGRLRSVKADLDESGAVDAADVQRIVRALLEAT